MCLECSGKQRDFGVHISFVRSITMDSWSEIQLRKMESGGNEILNKFLSKYGIAWQSPEMTWRIFIGSITYRLPMNRAFTVVCYSIKKNASPSPTSFDLTVLLGFLLVRSSFETLIFGQVIQLQGDQRRNVSSFLTQAGIVKKDYIKIHGF
ncbi:hypothetical protein L1987_85164 [Smallanthus sonchifolius]|uniref:Uncharacterized protein n=1 Tax=Smallanthus sonchifolius TaxID=185202 RepID=A0ACB8XXD2_9ASTR|nr:hypothetical protein L1987_85164 [Smallanthus sonchifolius]